MCDLRFGAFALLGVLAPLLAPYAYAQQPPTTLAAAAAEQQPVALRLKEVKLKIEKESEQIKRLQAQQLQLQKALEVAAEKLSEISAQRDEARVRVEKVGTEALVVERAISRIRDELDHSRANLRQRTVAIYKMYRRTTALDYLFDAASVTDLLKRSRYLSIIASNDRTRLERLRVLVTQLEDEQRGLEQLRAEQSAELARVEELKRDLESKKQEQEELLSSAKAEREKEELTLKKLNSMASELESALAGIMGAEEEPTVTPSVPPEPPGYSGVGLATFKGKLPSPVSGSVVQRFGEHRHDEFSDILFSKGLEFSADIGGKALAVAPGKVVFNQVLPGYGNVVILDHGLRYYSLYGRLASSLVKLGDAVRAGDTVAVLGELDRKGRNFYFELRHQGKAIDPSSFFRDRFPTNSSQ